MTYTHPTTRAIDALHHIAETLETWAACGELAALSDYVRAEMAELPAALRAVGKELSE